MKRENRISKVGRIKAVIGSLLLIVGFTVPSYSRVDSSAFKSEYQVLAGVSSSNNIAFAFGRYVLIAPFAPSKPVTESTSKEELDNHFIYILDAKKVNSEPDKHDLGCYYPTKVYFDSETQNVYIKGTEIVENTATGEYQAISVLKYLHLNLPDNGKPVVDGLVQTIQIPGINEQFATESPDDLVITNKFFIFTNGASIFTFEKNQGLLYTVDFITKKDYDPVSNAITHLGFDHESEVLTILTNRKSESDGEWKHRSELYIYKLTKNGTINLLTKIAPDAFPDQDFIPSGSKIAINWSGEEGKENFAYFPGANGVLYQTRLTGESQLSGTVEPLTQDIDGLKQPVGEYLSNVSTSYFKESRTIEAIRNGYTDNIHRPANFRGRLGKIHRPANLRFMIEKPSVVLAAFGKKNRVLKTKVFDREFEQEQGILDPFTDKTGTRYLASQNGNIFELSLGQVDDSTVSLVGQLGNRLGTVGYFRDVFVGVEAYELDEAGQIVVEGGVVIARRQEDGNFISSVNWTEKLLAGNSVLGINFGSIRRPCNTRPQ